jgi:hypothetical protein
MLRMRSGGAVARVVVNEDHLPGDAAQHHLETVEQRLDVLALVQRRHHYRQLRSGKVGGPAVALPVRAVGLLGVRCARNLAHGAKLLFRPVAQLNGRFVAADGRRIGCHFDFSQSLQYQPERQYFDNFYMIDVNILDLDHGVGHSNCFGARPKYRSTGGQRRSHWVML